MIEERKRLEGILEEFRAFLPSRIHSEYKAATLNSIIVIETRILEDEITSLSDLFTLLDLRTQRRVQKASLSSFEDTVANLEDRISQMKADEETPNATQQIEENEDETESTDDVP